MRCACCSGGTGGPSGCLYKLPGSAPSRRLDVLQEHLARASDSDACVAACAGGAAGADGGVPVNTVLGAVSSRRLGCTLSHEHVCITAAGIPQVYPDFVPRDRVIRDGVASLTAYRGAGGASMIDCTTMDIGRDIRLIEAASRGSGVNIVASTGCWIDIPRSWQMQDPDRIAQLYAREVAVGIEGTGIKAGIVKCAHETGVSWVRGKGFSHAGEVSIRACARAAKLSGAPITTHTEVAEYIGEAQIRVFEEEGVDLNRVYIGHSNDTDDLGYLTRMLRKGVWLGLDRCSLFYHTDWERRAALVKRLVDDGWGHRIMLAHDTMVYNAQLPEKYTRSNMHRAGTTLTGLDASDGYCFIARKVLPWLHAHGVGEEQTRKIMHDNPRRFFENAR